MMLGRRLRGTSRSRLCRRVSKLVITMYGVRKGLLEDDQTEQITPLEVLS